MSVANIHIAADRVWLASDTLQFLDGRPHSFASKCSLWPHLYALAGFRGLVGLHHRLDCWMNGWAVDVEDAAARLPAPLCAWRDDLRREFPEHHAHIKGQIWLAGWAPSRKAFAGWRFSSEVDFEQVELEVPSTHMNPGCEDVGYAPPAMIRDPMQLVQCVEVQKRMAQANIDAGGGDLGIGGEVVLVELSKSGFAIRKAHRFDDYVQIRERLRAR